MPRARYVKPGLFKDDEIAEVDFQTRLFFIGLWTHADRDGRVTLREKQMKAEIFPFDNADIPQMINELVEIGKVQQGEIEGKAFVQVMNWEKHQKIHPNEPSAFSNQNESEQVTRSYEESTEPLKNINEPQNRNKLRGLVTSSVKSPLDLDLDLDSDLNLDSSLDAKPDGTATKLNLFLKRLGKAGLHVPQAPSWLLTAMSNGRADTYLKAAEELQYTKFMEGDKPSTIDNFKEKSFGWVEQLASGKWSKGGPPPQAAPVDPATVKSTVAWCDGKRLTPAEEEAAKTHPDTKHLWENYQRQHKRNLSRDNHRGDTPSADAPIPQAIPRPVLKNADEDFDTAAAQRRALEQIAAFEKSSQGGCGLRQENAAAPRQG